MCVFMTTRVVSSLCPSKPTRTLRSIWTKRGHFLKRCSTRSRAGRPSRGCPCKERSGGSCCAVKSHTLTERFGKIVFSFNRSPVSVLMLVLLTGSCPTRFRKRLPLSATSTIRASHSRRTHYPSVAHETTCSRHLARTCHCVTTALACRHACTCSRQSASGRWRHFHATPSSGAHLHQRFRRLLPV